MSKIFLMPFLVLAIWVNFEDTTLTFGNCLIYIQNKIKLIKWKDFNNFDEARFSPNGKQLALLSVDDVEIVDISSSRRITKLTPSSALILGAKFSPDGRFLATAERHQENAQTNSFQVTLWDISTGKEKLSLPVVNDEWYRVVDDLSFSPDGSLLASNLGGIARLWNTSDGSEVKRFLPPDDKQPLQSERVLLSPNGQWLTVYFKNQKLGVDIISLWNLSRPSSRLHP